MSEWYVEETIDETTEEIVELPEHVKEMKLIEVAYHRNGIVGEGFWVAIVERYEKRFLVNYFGDMEENNGGLYTTVTCLDLLQGDKATIKSPNEWRPEEFADFMHFVAVPQHEKEMDEQLAKMYAKLDEKPEVKIIEV